MQRAGSWAVQNQIRGVLGWMTADAMKNSRFCQLYRDKNATKDCVRCIEDERKHSERDEET